MPLLLTVAVAQTRPLVLTLTGTPHERGVQHGQSLRTEIATLHERWAADIQQTFGLSLDEFVTRFLAGTRFEPAITKATPELLEEVRGIAKGSGVRYESMLVWQLIDEVWASAPAVVRDKCTAIGVDRRGEQPTIVAQNLDIPTWYHGFQVVLRIRDGESESLVVTIPGVIGACGLNRAGVAIACNTLLQLQPCRDGLPVAFVVRGVLAQRDEAAAVAFVQSVRHASGQCYTIGGREHAHAYECSAAKVVRCESHPGAPFVVHTNHPIANDDLTERAKARAPGLPALGGRCPRMDWALSTWSADSAPDVAAIGRLLGSTDSKPGICNEATFASVVMLLGDQPELRIAPGRPDRVASVTVRFDD